MSKPENLLIIDPAQELKFKGKRRNRNFAKKTSENAMEVRDVESRLSLRRVPMGPPQYRLTSREWIQRRARAFLRGAIICVAKKNQRKIEEKKVKNHRRKPGSSEIL